MPAERYGADTDDGYRIDDPSPEAIAVLIDELHPADNAFVVIRPDGASPAWCATVSVVDDIYAIEYRVHGEGRRLCTYAEREEVLSAVLRWLDVRCDPTLASVPYEGAGPWGLLDEDFPLEGEDEDLEWPDEDPGSSGDGAAWCGSPGEGLGWSGDGVAARGWRGDGRASPEEIVAWRRSRGEDLGPSGDGAVWRGSPGEGLGWSGDGAVWRGSPREGRASPEEIVAWRRSHHERSASPSPGGGDVGDQTA
ncbi:hypothetical protein GCM10023193_69120 [Planotetraspora kaengkrachanensis]|uniref:Uncharacterized protein n=1 Tax=Planotetraspora kaengkrachanensis TaxID=575193 RepID=A0A8J3VA93_9ACTN|nr:hypothetical protein Pka01_63440 [Planotetraspora kaengkrachanensis]